MSYALVLKNNDGEWYISKYLTSTKNQYSPVTGYTIGDVTILDAEGRLWHGFWRVDDVYVGTGEFTELDNTVVNWNDTEGVVTNTYTYKLMDLAVIREEMNNRVRNYRQQLSVSPYTKDGKVYDLSTDGRCELQGLVLETLLDSTIDSVSIRLQSGEDVSFTAAELKAFYLEVAQYREGLFDTEEQLIAAINAATDYDAIRAAAKWGDVDL